MNLLLLAVAVRAWSGSALSVFLRLMAAIALFSVEMQLATWSSFLTIDTLLGVNVVAAAAGLWLTRRSPHGRPALLPPPVALAALALLVAALAIALPVTAADPYHLQRVDRILDTGTLAYDAGAPDLKVNVMAGVYELMLADLRVPGMQAPMLRLHGLLGLGFYLLAIAAVQTWLPLKRRWTLVGFLVVPVVFHQLVLVKNDLFGALPAYVALAWVVVRGRDSTLAEVGAAAALAGFAAGLKVPSIPVACVVALFVCVDHRADWRALATLVIAGIIGAAAGGLLFALVENTRYYGGPLEPYVSLGNRNVTAGEVATGLVRFAISLFDLGRITPRLWPGRGGWGSTLGLPLIWALAVLALRCNRPVVARALLAAAISFGLFAATYPDADIAHRMVIAPGLLLIAVAVANVDEDDKTARRLRAALVPVIALSALQIARSAVLYLQQPPG